VDSLLLAPDELQVVDYLSDAFDQPIQRGIFLPASSFIVLIENQWSHCRRHRSCQFPRKRL
jgi:hypothetical protein